MTTVRAAPEILEELAPPAGLDVIDVGCGAGGLARRLAGLGARVVGVDVSTVALERARAQAGAGERYLEGRAEALPLPDASADLVVFHNSLHHVPGLDRALAEARRVVRPGGAVYVQEPLAEGAYFELVRRIDDETRVRALAQAAIARAAGAGAGLELERELRFDTDVRLTGFEGFRDAVVLSDARRAEAFAEHEADLRARFADAAEPAGDGVRFRQPNVAQLLRRPAS